MLKVDVLEYIGKNKEEGEGVSNVLAKILRVSEPAVCQWGERIPPMQAMRLEKLFNDPEVIEQYNLSNWDKPVFCEDDYGIGAKGGHYNKYTNNSATSNAAKKVMARVDKEEGLGAKLNILTRFIKKLIK